MIHPAVASHQVDTEPTEQDVHRVSYSPHDAHTSYGPLRFETHADFAHDNAAAHIYAEYGECHAL